MMTFFKNLPIRLKLFLSYALIFIIATLAAGSGIYYQVKSTIETNIENELRNSIATIHNMVKTAATTSIKNYLRAVAELNLEIITAFYQEYKQGLMTEDEAKTITKKILLSQSIGKTGYLYCVNSNGIAPVHPNPKIVGNNFLDLGFIRELIRLKEGYLEYDWKSPEDDHPRSKALYMSYFEPWDWIIAVSSYREEFKELVNVSDFRDSILELSFGKTGYAFVLDSMGKVIVHPEFSGNYFDAQSEDGQFFIRDICKLKNGKLVYSWKNPGETTFRDKIVLFNYIPEYDWIVACSSYLDEMYAPLDSIKNIILLMVCLITFLVFLTSLWVNHHVILPLQNLMDRFSLGASGCFSVRMPVTSRDEIGKLAAFFNEFMETLEVYHADLASEIKKHKESETALRLSEEMFSKAFRCSPSGMFIASLTDNRVINVNDSFLTFTGYSPDDILEKDLMALNFFQNKTDGHKLMETLTRKRRLKNVEIKFRTATGERRSGTLSAEMIELWGEPCILAAMEDLTESKRLEREILNISERERQKIAMELHDDLCPQLIGIEVMTRLLEKKLAERSFELTLDAKQIGQILLDTIAKTRKISKGLCPVNLSDHGFDLSLMELCDYVKKVFEIECEFKFEGVQYIRDNTVASHLYYIAHEAVHNSARHSKAKKISMDLIIREQGLSLKVSDNGKGMKDIRHSRGMGLKIMSYRANRIGGTLEITHNKSGGVLVQLYVDL